MIELLKTVTFENKEYTAVAPPLLDAQAAPSPAVSA